MSCGPTYVILVLCVEASSRFPFFVLRRLENANIRDFPLKWVKGSGLDPLHDPTHSSYLQKAFANCLELLKAQIDTALEEYEASPGGGDLYKEVVFHGHYCKERAKDFKVSPQVQEVHLYCTLHVSHVYTILHICTLC